MNNILLIEDDKLSGEGLADFFNKKGFRCTWLKSISNVEKYWISADLVLLGRQLTEGDSAKFLPSWLAKKAIPVIILTAKVEVEKSIEILMAGARDCIVKPFSYMELLARIIAQLRPLGESNIQYEDISINVSARTVRYQGKLIEMTTKEFDLLLLLVQNQDRVFHREEILNKTWGYQAFPTTRTVDTHILRIRKKLPSLNIETLRRIGYRLKNNTKP